MTKQDLFDSISIYATAAGNSATKTKDTVFTGKCSGSGISIELTKKTDSSRLPTIVIKEEEKEEDEDKNGLNENSFKNSFEKDIEEQRSPLARCMTKEEIDLLSRNSTSSLEKELIEYLKMQPPQQQQQLQPQQQRHNNNQQQNHYLQLHLQHNNNSTLKPSSTSSFATISSGKLSVIPITSTTPTTSTAMLNHQQHHHNIHHHHNQQQQQQQQQQNHHQQRNYQSFSTTPSIAQHNLSSPTDIANYMNGQNPMQQHHSHSVLFPMPVSQIKKEVDSDRNGMFSSFFFDKLVVNSQ